MLALDPVTPVWRSNYVMALSYAQRLDEAEALTEGNAAEPDSRRALLSAQVLE